MAGLLRLLLVAGEQREKGQNQLADFLAIGHKHGCQRAKVQQYIKEQVFGFDVCQPEKCLKNGQVARAGDGKKLCHTLYNAQDDCG